MTSIFLKLRGEHLPFVLVAFSFASGSLASLEPRAPRSPQVPARHATVRSSAGDVRLTHAFEWPGTYDLLGTGFADGPRVAVLTVTPRDTSYHFEIAGPPGALKSLRVVGDSAHVAWDMGGPVMMVDLRGSGDSLDGRWYVGEESGDIIGTRRR
jgi:hypothetical protein